VPQVVKNLISGILGQSVVLILGLVASKFIFSGLGPEALGLIYFTWTMSALVASALDLGVATTLVREISGSWRRDDAYVIEVARTATTIGWLVYASLAVSVWLAAPLIPRFWLMGSEFQPETTTTFFQIVGPASLLLLPRSIYASMLRGIHRVDLTNFIDVGALVFQQAGLALILSLGGDIFALAWWLAGSHAASVAFSVVAAAKYFSAAAFVPGYSGRVIQRNFHYASRVALISILSSIHIQGDKAIVSKLLPPAIFGPYALAATVVSRLTLLANAVAQAALPYLSMTFAVGGASALRNQYYWLHESLCLAGVPVLALVIFASRPLFTYLLDSPTAESLLLPVGLLTLGSYMNGTMTVPYICSLAAGRPGIAVRLNLYAIFTILPATVLLVWIYGTVGGGISWVLYHILAYYYAIPRICSQCLEIPAIDWYRHVLKIGFLAIGTYGAVLVVLFVIGATSIGSLALAYASASAIFLMAAYWTADAGVKRVAEMRLREWLGIAARSQGTGRTAND
jgi:O-antigen/teichoic acid export membrane protein